jgi:activating signal cointegrator 1
MKVISLLQPHATLAVIGAKRIESRSFDTKFRGEILIHASLSNKWAKELCNVPGKRFFSNYIRHWTDLTYGAIIGKVTIVGTIPSEKVQDGFGVKVGDNAWHFTEQEIAFGDYSPNRYGWLLKDAMRFETAIPAKGQLGFWNYDLPYPLTTIV